jgi:GxxExxY protein
MTRGSPRASMIGQTTNIAITRGSPTSPVSRVSRQINYSSNNTVPPITNIESFDNAIVHICNSILETLSSKQQESTFQKCLVMDLIKAGVKICDQEVNIIVTYNGRRVGARRADIVLQTPLDGKRAVLELKVARTLTYSHRNQLEFYMHHLGIDTGYLINFACDSGCFPDAPSKPYKTDVVVLSGDSDIHSDSNDRASSDAQSLQVVKLRRLFEAPIARTTGRPCQLCSGKKRLCDYHVDRCASKGRTVP